MSIFDNLTASDFKTQFPRFTPQYLSDITYSATKTYFKDDIVYYETLFYKCKKQTTTNLPTVTADWDLYNDSVLNYTTDENIQSAYAEARVNFNPSLFEDEETAKLVFLYLAAFYATYDFAIATGTASVGVATSKSVGSVSESYGISTAILEKPQFAIYAQNGYGCKYLSLIMPYLTGAIFLIPGKTTIS